MARIGIIIGNQQIRVLGDREALMVMGGSLRRLRRGDMVLVDEAHGAKTPLFATLVGADFPRVIPGRRFSPAGHRGWVSTMRRRACFRS